MERRERAHDGAHIGGICNTIEKEYVRMNLLEFIETFSDELQINLLSSDSRSLLILVVLFK